MEHTLREKEIFNGKVLHVFCDDVLADNGTPCVREYIRHPGGVTVLAVQNGQAYFVRQYRYALKKELLELPAGKLERGEDPYFAGIRELREETGLVAQKLIPLGCMIPTPGYSNEVIWLYLAEGLSQGEASPDEDECLTVVKIDFDTAVQMAQRGEFEDAKTALLLLKAKAYFEEVNL